jgi:AraC family transcriptional regulator
VKPPTSPAAPAKNAHYEGNSRRVLGQIETPSVTIDEVEYAAGFCLPRHSHDYASFTWNVDGVHWSSLRHAGYTCTPGTMRFLPAGEPHENYFPTGSRCLRAELRTPILDHAKEYGAVLSRSGELATPSAAKLGELLLKEFRQNDDLSIVSIEGLALELLLAYSRGRMSPEGPVPAWLGRVRELLHEESASRLSLAELARCAGRHPVQVCRQFRSRFGCTIGEYVRRVRIARAQSLLVSSEFGIAEIALACGFSDQSQFTTAFRRLTGMPPRRYRKKHARNPVAG